MCGLMSVHRGQPFSIGRFLILVSLWLASCDSAFACRYTVRDVAFVELSRESFSIEVPADLLESPEYRRNFERESRRFLRDSNVRLIVRPDLDSGSARLIDETGDVLQPLDLTWLRDEWHRGAESFWTALLRGSVGERVLSETVNRLAVVLMVESVDEGDNARAGTLVDSAIRKIQPLLSKMPKPVDLGPVALRISFDERTDERALLWSLGFDISPQAPTQVAVLVGRGRRLGPVLDSVTLNETALVEAFVIAGQDCECDLDRSWMQGPRFPMIWDESRRIDARDALGFDTEDPMVRSEISRIIARGGSQSAPQSLGQEFDALSIGYTEVALGDSANAVERLDDDALLAALDSSLGKTEAEPPPLEPSLERESIVADAKATASNGMGIWIGLGALGVVVITAGLALILFRRH